MACCGVDWVVGVMGAWLVVLPVVAVMLLPGVWALADQVAAWWGREPLDLDVADGVYASASVGGER